MDRPNIGEVLDSVTSRYNNVEIPTPSGPLTEEEKSWVF